jgi:hypothetical protein
MHAGIALSALAFRLPVISDFDSRPKLLRSKMNYEPGLSRFSRLSRVYLPSGFAMRRDVASRSLDATNQTEGVIR